MSLAELLIQTVWRGPRFVCFYEDAPAEWTKTALIPLHPGYHYYSAAFFLRAVPSWGSRHRFTPLLLRSSLRCSQALPLLPDCPQSVCSPPLLPRATALFFLLLLNGNSFIFGPLHMLPLSFDPTSEVTTITYWCVASLGFPSGAGGEASVCQCR